VINTDFSVGYGDIRFKHRSRHQLTAFRVSSNKDNHR